MKNQVVIRKIRAIWVDLKSEESAEEQMIALILAAILAALFADVVIFWR